jgi:hypothetical protein
MVVPPITPPSARPAARRVISDQIRQSLGPQPNVGAVEANVDPLHEQLHDARLIGREQLVPQRIEPVQGVANLGFRDIAP